VRRRVLFVLLVCSAALVVMFGAPLLTGSSTAVAQRLDAAQRQEVDRLVVVAAQDPVLVARQAAALFAVYGDGVLVVDGDRKPIVTTGGLGTSDRRAMALAASALRNAPTPPVAPVYPWTSEPRMVAEPIDTEAGLVGAVVVCSPTDSAARAVGAEWLRIGGGLLAVTVLGVALAMATTRWLIGPLARVTAGLGAMADGRRGARVAESDGPRELSALVGTFNRMATAVEAAAEQQRRLVADASHQLRNPLAAVRLRVDDLAPSVEPAAQEAYRALVADVERMETTVAGLLSMAHAEAEQPGTSASCDLAAVVPEQVATWRVTAEARGVELRSDRPPDALHVACSAFDLVQVIDVLVDNATRYGATEVAVSMRADGADAVVEVRDDGDGLTVEECELALHRFWRGPRANGPGTGLGLAIAARLVDRNGGSLRLRPAGSRGLRAGFTLALAEPVR
jgi:signal transduction histidine kinase